MTVLYIEDDGDYRDIFRDAISVIAPHTKCFYANDAREAKEFLITRVALDYIFLDLHLPDLNGESLLQEIKNIEHQKSVPVVMFTTSDSDIDMLTCRRLGAFDFVTKGQNFSSICSSLKKFL